MINKTYIGVLVMGLSTVILSGWTQEPDRVLVWERGKSIQRQLIPEDRLVVVIKAQSPLHLGPPLALDEDLRRINDTAAAIAIIDVESTEVVMTPRGDWAQTKVKSKLRDLVKSSDKATLGMSDGSFEFAFDGGELKLGNTTVRVGEYPFVKAGTRCLVMFALDPVALRWHPFQPFRVDDGGLLRRVEFFKLEPFHYPTPIDGRNLSEIVSRLRALQPK